MCSYVSYFELLLNKIEYNTLYVMSGSEVQNPLNSGSLEIKTTFMTYSTIHMLSLGHGHMECTKKIWI